MSLWSSLNPATTKLSTMAGQDRLTATEQPKALSGNEPIFDAKPFSTPLFSTQANPAPVTARPSASGQLFGNNKDQPLGAICDKTLSTDGVLSFGALTKSPQPVGKKPESNGYIGGMMAQGCIRDDVIRYFLDTWEVTLANWMLLLHKTALPEDGINTAQQMAIAVNALESVIAGQELLPAKFGYLQLSNFLDALESRIQLQKDNGEECKGKSAATIAFDRYLAVQGLQGKKQSKDALSYKRKIGRRWKDLASLSSLLLLAFSDAAEDFVKRGCDAPFAHSLESFATEIYKIIPENLLHTCVHVSGVAEMAVRVGKGWDIPRVKEFRHQVSKLS